MPEFSARGQLSCGMMSVWTACERRVPGPRHARDGQTRRAGGAL